MSDSSSFLEQIPEVPPILKNGSIKYGYYRDGSVQIPVLILNLECEIASRNDSITHQIVVDLKGALNLENAISGVLKEFGEILGNE